MAWVLTFMVTFLPSIFKVFFCKFGLNVRLLCCCEKLTLWPNCFPLPVNSHFAAISFSFYYADSELYLGVGKKSNSDLVYNDKLYEFLDNFNIHSCDCYVDGCARDGPRFC